MSIQNNEIDAVKIAFDKWYNTQGWDQWDYELLQFSAEFVMEFAEQYAASRISELEARVKELEDANQDMTESYIDRVKELNDRIAELEAENEKNIKWANDAETRAIAAEERIVELEAENKRLREKSAKWDALAAKMEKLYAEDSDADLCDVGEAASAAFGYECY